MSSFKDIAKSKPCKFRVGRQKAVFYVPPVLVCEHSKILYDLMHECDGDTSKNSVALDNIHEDTFTRFVEFLYTGEYAAAKPTTRVQSIETSAAEDSDEDHTPATSKADHGESCTCRLGPYWGSRPACDCDSSCAENATETRAPPQPEPVWSVVTKSKKKPRNRFAKEPQESFETPWMSRRVRMRASHPEIAENGDSVASTHEQAWETFKTLTWPLAEKEAKGSEYSAQANENDDEDYSEVFLSHARLHAFACSYDVSRLKALTLKNLHGTLTSFTIFQACAVDVAALLIYSYGERHDRVSELRKLVSDYVACNVQKLMKESSFRSVVQTCEEASFDLLELVVKRMQVQE